MLPIGAMLSPRSSWRTAGWAEPWPQRALTEEIRCSGCRTFCRRLGPGGYSPCCGEVITLEELLGA